MAPALHFGMTTRSATSPPAPMDTWAPAAIDHAGQPAAGDIEDFVALIVADDLETARAAAERVILQGGGRDALLRDLLTPAARRLGEMWSADLCDFMTVTLGVHRLDQIMKETVSFSSQNDVFQADDRHILLVPAPGEQHSFGLHMVADRFREGGWCVRAGMTLTRPQLLSTVRDEWFDAVGLSVSGEVALKTVSACIRGIRQASCNPRLYIMVGGHAMALHPERTRFLGADYVTTETAAALAAANGFVARTVATSLHQDKANLVDIG